jgi:glycosyltransferase involved in cell wall biosynthesis
MRIALFTETFLPKVDGIVTRLKYTIEHLQRSGDEVLIFCPDGGMDEYCGAEICGLSGVPLPLYPELKLAWPRPAIGRKLQEFNPDLIHVVNPAVLGLSGVYYAQKWDIPLLASYHTHLPKYLKSYKLGALEGTLWSLLRQVHNRAQLNLCTSTAMVTELKNHGIERVDLWQRGVDTETFHPSRRSDEMRDFLSRGKPTAPLLLYVGRLGAEKDVAKIRDVLMAVPHARLAIVGDGPQRVELERHFADTATHFVGYLHGVELAAAYAVADAFIFPSRTETLGLVLLEAMAAGCPVIAARAGGIPDIVTDGENGYLFDPLAADGAIEGALKLLNNTPIERDRLRGCARLEAERWSWGAATAHLQSYYQKVLALHQIS